MRSAAVSPRLAFHRFPGQLEVATVGDLPLWPKVTVEEAWTPEASGGQPLRASRVQRLHSFTAGDAIHVARGL